MKRTIIIAAIAFCIASCNNPSSPGRTNTDSSSVNSDMNTAPGAGNNTDTMSNMNNTDTTNNSSSADSAR